MRTAKSYLFGAAFFRLISVLAAFTVIFAMASCKFSADYLGDMSSVNAAAVAGSGETNASDQGNGETDASNQGGDETDATDTDESGTEQGTGGEEGTEPGTGNGGEEGTGTDGTEPGTGTGGEGTGGNETEKPTEPQKPVAPQLSNFRWGKSIDSVKEANKANWSPATYNKGDDVYVGLDLDVKADEVSSIKFTISRNGKLEWWYIVPNRPDAPYMGKLGEKSIWVNYPNGPTNFEGKLTLWLDITFNNGTVAGIGGDADVKEEFPVTNIRWGTTADSVKEANKANWKNAVIRTGDELYVGFDTDTSKVASIKFMLARNDKDGKNGTDNFKLYAAHGDYKDWGIIDAKGIWAAYTWSPTNYVGEAKVKIEIKYKNGALSYALATIPVREALAPAISNIRWGTTADSVKEANKANWKNAIIRSGDELYVGFDTDTSKVESIKFMLARNDKNGVNGKDQFKLYADHSNNKDWGISDAKGVWATYTQNPTNYVGEAKVSIEVKYKDGKYNWANATIPVKEALGPAITNIRWANDPMMLVPHNKNLWKDSVIWTGDKLYVGFDTDTSQVESVKFMLARNDAAGKNGKDQFKLYADHTNNKDWGKIDSSGIWATYTQNPTNFVGEAKVSIEVKYKDGKFNWANATIPVREVVAGNLRKITYEQTGVQTGDLNPTRFKAEYYEYGVFPQSLKKDDVKITGEKHQNQKWVKGSDGEWYLPCTTVTFRDETKKSSDGRDIKDNTTYYFKIEPIVWQRLPNSNKLISMKILTAGNFYGSMHWRADGAWRIFPSNYHHSSIRKWASESFLATAMNAEQKSKLLDIQVGTNSYDFHMDYVAKDYKLQELHFLFADMFDKAWIWSKQEISNPNAFGASKESGAATNRVKVATDYAIAFGLDVQRRNNVNYGSWWLRSPDWKDGTYAQTVDANGYAQTGSAYARVDNLHVGYVPGIALPADMLNNAPRK